MDHHPTDNSLSKEGSRGRAGEGKRGRALKSVPTTARNIKTTDPTAPSFLTQETTQRKPLQTCPAMTKVLQARIPRASQPSPHTGRHAGRLPSAPARPLGYPEGRLLVGPDGKGANTVATRSRCGVPGNTAWEATRARQDPQEGGGRGCRA